MANKQTGLSAPPDEKHNMVDEVHAEEVRQENVVTNMFMNAASATGQFSLWSPLWQPC